MQDVRTRARAREVEKTKIWSTQNGSRKYDSFFSKHPIKTSDVFQKTLDIFPKTWEVFQYISHVFSLRSDIQSLSQERFLIAQLHFLQLVFGFVHLFLYDNTQKEVQRRNERSKQMAQPQSTLKRQSWVDCRARSAGGEGTTPMLGQSYTSGK